MCLPASSVCDGVKDCGAGEDELGCPVTCSDQEVQCQDGSCGSLCDGVSQCRDGRDERNCCYEAQKQFSCRTGGCVELSQECDGRSDCEDGSDEHPGCGESVSSVSVCPDSHLVLHPL